jgi:predicted DNA-binding protein
MKFPFTVPMDEVVMANLKALAKQQGVAVALLIREAIRKVYPETEDLPGKDHPYNKEAR